MQPHEIQILGSWAEEAVPAERLSNFGFDLSCVTVRLAEGSRRTGQEARGKRRKALWQRGKSHSGLCICPQMKILDLRVDDKASMSFENTMR